MTSIGISSVLFGASPLGLGKSDFHLTPGLVIVIVVLNALPGFVFGLANWRRGLIAAMVTHFASDIVLHVIGSL